MANDLPYESFVCRMAEHLRGDLQFADGLLNEFLRDEKIEFGDARYGWSAADAETLVHEMLVD